MADIVVPAGYVNKVAMIDTETGAVIQRHPVDVHEIRARNPGRFEIAVRQDFATSEGRQSLQCVELAAQCAINEGDPERAEQIKLAADRQPALADLSDALKRLGHQNTEQLAQLLASPIALPEPPVETPPQGAPEVPPDASKVEGHDGTSDQSEATPAPAAGAANDDESKT